MASPFDAAAKVETAYLRMVRTLFGLASLILLGAGLAASPALAEADDASLQTAAVETVEALHAGLTELMATASEKGVDGMQAFVGDVVDETYNLPGLTAQSISPSAFRQYSDEERSRVVAAYRLFAVANYVSQFGKKLPITFETIGASQGPNGAVLVETQLNRQNGDPVQLVYVIAGKDTQRGITDVQYNGVSEAARRRSELSSLAREGADVLAAALEDKAAQLAAASE